MALRAADAGLNHVVKITVFVTDVAQIQKFRDIRARVFTGAPPAAGAAPAAAPAPAAPAKEEAKKGEAKPAEPKKEEKKK